MDSTTTAGKGPAVSTNIPPAVTPSTPDNPFAILDIRTRLLLHVDALAEFKTWGCVDKGFAALVKPTIVGLRLTAFAATGRLREELRAFSDPKTVAGFAPADVTPEESQVLGSKLKHWVLELLAPRCSREQDPKQAAFLLRQGLAVASHLGRTVGLRTWFTIRSATPLPPFSFEQWSNELKVFGEGKEIHKALFAIAAFHPTSPIKLPMMVNAALAYTENLLAKWDKKITDAGKKPGSAIARIAKYAARTGQPQLLAALWGFLTHKEAIKERNIVYKAAGQLQPEQRLDWLLVAARSIPRMPWAEDKKWTACLWADLFDFARTPAIARPSNESDRRLQMKFLVAIKTFFEERHKVSGEYWYGYYKTHHEVASDVARCVLIAHELDQGLALGIATAYCEAVNTDPQAMQRLYHALQSGPFDDATLKRITGTKN